MSGSSSSQKLPVAPVVFNDALPAGSEQYSEESDRLRQEHYDRVRYSGEHLSGPLGNRWDPLGGGPPMTHGDHEREELLDAQCRAHAGGLYDAPDDGGPRAVSSKPFKF